MNSEDILRRRIEEVRQVRRANCVGTALYLVQERDKDEHIEPYHFNVRESGLILSEKPEFGAVVIWFYLPEGDIFHMGVITGLNPIQVTHRNGYGGVVVGNQSIERMEWDYATKPKFYLPKRLQG